jgi:hypothetical protein
MEPIGVERDHNRPDAFRYDPLRPPAGYASVTPPPEQPEQAVLRPGAPNGPGPAGTPTPEPQFQPRPGLQILPRPGQSRPPVPPAPPVPSSPPTPPTSPTPTPPQNWVGPSEPGAYDNSADPSTDQDRTPPDDKPTTAEKIDTPPDDAGQDVMLLPDPDDRNRPTIPLNDRVPGQTARPHTRPTEPLPRPTGDPATDARLEKLENSPFWFEDPEKARRLPQVSSHAGGRRRARRRGVIRKPAPALFALITLALVATFFAWVSAEPFWLAVGHGDRGFATTTECRGTGVAQRCTGHFETADGSFAVARVALLGVADDKRASGAVSPARMVSAKSGTAYLGDTSPLVQLRWMLGFVLVLICGYGIASLTGARRLDDPRARRLVTLASVFAPIVLLAGFLAAAY